MLNETLLIIGIVIGVFTVPSILSAIKDGGAPRVATFSAMVSGCLIVYAVANQPGGFAIEDLPQIFNRVINGVSI